MTLYARTSVGLLRYMAGLRKKDLIELTDLTHQTIHAFENEAGPSRVEDAVMLADVLDAPLSAVSIRNVTDDQETHG